MNACKVLELIELNKIKVLKNCAIEEIKQCEIKLKNGVSELQRYKLASKYLKKVHKSTSDESFYTAWTEEGYQCFCDGYTGFLLKNHIPGINVSCQDKFSLLEIYKNLKCNNYTEFKIDFNDVNAQLKMSKAQKIKTCRYYVNEKCYNAAYIMDCFKILGGKEVTFTQPTSNKKMSPAILENNNGIALLSPIKEPKNNKCN